MSILFEQRLSPAYVPGISTKSEIEVNQFKDIFLNQRDPRVARVGKNALRYYALNPDGHSFDTSSRQLIGGIRRKGNCTSMGCRMRGGCGCCGKCEKKMVEE